MSKRGPQSTKFRERVLLVAVQLPPETDEGLLHSLEELQRLVETLGGETLGSVTQRRYVPEPATFIGRGKAEEIAQKAEETEATLVAFDNELNGTQLRNLEKIFNVRVIDRTGVILDIFSRHARSKEAKVQVELATLEYLSSRLTRRWTHLERQRGGIGLRGVGEKQIELDRRLIRGRIAKLKDQLEHMASERATQRRHRDRYIRVAIVGYTNAGKSTLLNRLTSAEVLVDDRLFATLDSTVRLIDPKTKPPILLSDTVGFIKKLPHSLVASFRSTLQEVLEADLLLHVVNLASPTYEEEMAVTQAVLEEIGAKETPSFLVFNKADLVEDKILPKLLLRRYVHSIVVSALNDEDIHKLRDAIYHYFEQEMLELDVVIPYGNAWLAAKIHEFSKVLDENYIEEGTKMKIRILRADARWLKLIEESGREVQ